MVHEFPEHIYAKIRMHINPKPDISLESWGLAQIDLDTICGCHLSLDLCSLPNLLLRMPIPMPKTTRPLEC